MATAVCSAGCLGACRCAAFTRRLVLEPQVARQRVLLRLHGDRDGTHVEVAGYSLSQLRGCCEYIRSLLDFGIANAGDSPAWLGQPEAEGEEPGAVREARAFGVCTGSCPASLAADVVDWLLKGPQEAPLDVDGSNAAELLSLADLWCLAQLKAHVLLTLRRTACNNFRRPAPGSPVLEQVPGVAVLAKSAMEFGVGDADGGLQRLYGEAVSWMGAWPARVWPTRTFATLRRSVQDDVLTSATAALSPQSAPAVLAACRQLGGALPSVAWAGRVQELRGALAETGMRTLWGRFEEACVSAGQRRERSECWNQLLAELHDHVLSNPDADAAVRVLPAWQSITRALLYGITTGTTVVRQAPSAASGRGAAGVRPLVGPPVAARGMAAAAGRAPFAVDGGFGAASRNDGSGDSDEERHSWLGEEEAEHMRALYNHLRVWLVRNAPCATRCSAFRELPAPAQIAVMELAFEGVGDGLGSTGFGGSGGGGVGSSGGGTAWMVGASPSGLGSASTPGGARRQTAPPAPGASTPPPRRVGSHRSGPSAGSSSGGTPPPTTMTSVSRSAKALTPSRQQQQMGRAPLAQGPAAGQAAVERREDSPEQPGAVTGVEVSGAPAAEEPAAAGPAASDPESGAPAAAAAGAEPSDASARGPAPLPAPPAPAAAAESQPRADVQGRAAAGEGEAGCSSPGRQAAATLPEATTEGGGGPGAGGGAVEGLAAQDGPSTAAPEAPVGAQQRAWGADESASPREAPIAQPARPSEQGLGFPEDGAGNTAAGAAPAAACLNRTRSADGTTDPEQAGPRTAPPVAPCTEAPAATPAPMASASVLAQEITAPHVSTPESRLSPLPQAAAATAAAAAAATATAAAHLPACTGPADADGASVGSAADATGPAAAAAALDEAEAGVDDCAASVSDCGSAVPGAGGPRSASAGGSSCCGSGSALVEEAEPDEGKEAVEAVSEAVEARAEAELPHAARPKGGAAQGVVGGAEAPLPEAPGTPPAPQGGAVSAGPRLSASGGGDGACATVGRVLGVRATALGSVGAPAFSQAATPAATTVAAEAQAQAQAPQAKAGAGTSARVPLSARPTASSAARAAATAAVPRAASVSAGGGTARPATASRASGGAASSGGASSSRAASGAKASARAFAPAPGASAGASGPAAAVKAARPAAAGAGAAAAGKPAAVVPAAAPRRSGSGSATVSPPTARRVSTSGQDAAAPRGGASVAVRGPAGPGRAAAVAAGAGRGARSSEGAAGAAAGAAPLRAARHSESGARAEG